MLIQLGDELIHSFEMFVVVAVVVLRNLHFQLRPLGVSVLPSCMGRKAVVLWVVR